LGGRLIDVTTGVPLVLDPVGVSGKGFAKTAPMAARKVAAKRSKNIV